MPGQSAHQQWLLGVTRLVNENVAEVTLGQTGSPQLRRGQGQMHGSQRVTRAFPEGDQSWNEGA